MSGCHSNSECENILSSGRIENKFFNSKEHSEQLDKIIRSKGKLVVYLSIIYGLMILVGLIYLFVS